ncbi:MAG: extracellular solute-binding protein, partial [Oscillospiraceae bacterium]
ATSGQLPTMYTTFHTEVKKIIDAGFSADITEELKKVGYLEKMNPDLVDLVKKDGKVFGIPRDAYSLGLTANVELFRQADLLDENGVPKFPKTYEELAQTASTIKQKTGKAGMVLPTINNCGGWHFMNIAWSFGTEFMKQENGKWKATFNSPETVAALQYVKDLKWKYNALPDNALIDIPEMQKLFATDQGAMYFSAPPDVQLVEVYDMDKKKFSVGAVPEGPKGKYSLTGGKAYMFNPNATPEQIDACLKWLTITGESPEINDDQKKAIDTALKTQADDGQIVGIYTEGAWKDDERLKFVAETTGKYQNIETKMFEQYMKNDGVKIRPEEPMNCQELYKILDACIQEVITEKDSDPKALIEKANSDFQQNYLDKIS